MSKQSQSVSLADFISSNLEPILQEWEDFAQSLVPLAGLDRKALRDHAESMLVAVVTNMGAPQSEAERSRKGKGNDQADGLTDAAESHAVARLGDNFTLVQLMAEFRAIRASVLRQWARVRPDEGADVEDIMRFNEAIDQAITASIERYSSDLDASRAVILGILAHDLRNPLNAISLGMQYILRTESADAPTMKAAVRAQQSVQRMNALVRDLLDFTRARLGSGLPVHAEPLDMRNLTQRTIEEVEAAHPGRKIRLETSGELPGEWDSGRIAQLIVNLVTNALHHGTADGEVRVTLTGDEAHVVLKIHNMGPAIPASVRQSIFEPLNRAMMNRRGGPAESSGLGLGLYIAHEIAIAHQGTLEVESTESAGTTFTTRLPRHPTT